MRKHFLSTVLVVVIPIPMTSVFTSTLNAFTAYESIKSTGRSV